MEDTMLVFCIALTRAGKTFHSQVKEASPELAVPQLLTRRLCFHEISKENALHPRWTGPHQVLLSTHTVRAPIQSEMFDRILTRIDALEDLFAAEMCHQCSRWRKCLAKCQGENVPRNNLYFICKMFNWSQADVFTTFCFSSTSCEHYKGFLLTIKHYWETLDLTLVERSRVISDMLRKEFQGRLGFHDRCCKNESTLVTYQLVEATSKKPFAHFVWVISSSLAMLSDVLRTHLLELPVWLGCQVLNSRPKGPNNILLKFLAWLKNPSMQNFEDSTKDPNVYALTLLMSYIMANIPNFKQLLVTLHGLIRSWNSGHTQSSLLE